jgi:hypothetical protein
MKNTEVDNFSYGLVLVGRAGKKMMEFVVRDGMGVVY